MSTSKHVEYRASGINYLVGVLITIICLVVALRFYVRIFIKQSFGFDDAFIGFALLTAIGFNLLVAIAAHSYGFRQHAYDIPIDTLESTLKSAMLCKILFSIAATFTRASILCFYTRLVQNTGKSAFKWCCWVGQFLNFVSAVVMLGYAIFLCAPVSLYWHWVDRFANTPDCKNEATAAVIAGAMNGITDLIVTILPMFLIYKLKLPLHQRWAIGVLLSLGFLVTIVGVVRTYFMWYTLASKDMTWNSFPLWIVATLEIALMVVCACAPALQPLTRKGWRNIRSFSFPSKKSSAAVSKEPPHIHLYTGKDEMHCRCTELRELEDRLCNPQEYSARTPTTTGGTSLNTISKRPGTPLEWYTKDDESIYGLRETTDVSKLGSEHICGCRSAITPLGPSTELLNG